MADPSTLFTLSLLFLDFLDLVSSSDYFFSVVESLAVIPLDDSFAVTENLSGDVVLSVDSSSAVSSPTIPPPQSLTEADVGDLVAADLVNDDDNDVVCVLDVDDDVSTPTIPPPQTLTATDVGHLVAADLVNDDDDRVVRALDVADDYRRRRYSSGDEDQGDDDDEDYADYGLDDELIPKSVSKKLKKQRMRKLGKLTSGKIPYTQLKPGCIYGKHGFGIRFRC